MRALLLAPLLLAGCWTLDLPTIPTERIPFDPDVGAPDGWWVEGFETDLRCPDGQRARFYMVYPEAADARVIDDPVELPLAVVLHSGAFDYVFDPRPESPTTGETYQTDLGRSERLTLDWATERIYATLGLYPNFDPVEQHAGALPAALATKGIASLLPTNCWGDLWHNRSSVAENNFALDLYFRDGRTSAEFGWRYGTEAFPPGNPLELPIQVDGARVYLVGLGEGARGVGELLTIRNEDSTFPYRPAAVVLDSPIDDLRVYYDGDTEALQDVRAGLNRIFPEGRRAVLEGAPSQAPSLVTRTRVAVLVSSNDTEIPAGANDLLFQTLGDTSTGQVWIHRGVQPAHVLSNADVTVAKGVADFLGEGVDAVDPELVD